MEATRGSRHIAHGSGLGYTVGANGFTGWLSLDGEEWVKLHDDFGMAIQPLVVAAEGVLNASNIP